MDTAFFLVTSGPQRQWLGPINGKGTIVGRWPHAGVRLDDLSVSQVHARLRARDDALEVQDLDSRNGTVLNGKRIVCALARDGDLLRFGTEVVQVRRVPTSGDGVLEGTTEAAVLGQGPKSQTFIVPASKGLFYALESLPDRLAAQAPDACADVSALYWLCATLGSLRDHRAIKQELLAWSRRWTGAERAMLVSRRDEKFAAVASSPEAADHLERHVSWSVVFRAMEQQAAVVHNCVEECAELADCDSIVRSRTGAVLCVPVPGPGAPIGAFYLSKAQGGGGFSERDVQLMLGAARVLSIGLRQRRREHDLSRRNRQLRRELRQQYRIVAGPSMDHVLRQVRQAAKVQAAVLLTGESGTGKELAARVIHFEGSRAGRPFVALNCGALNESLLESELFGHERGAFTGAAHQHRGVFERADGGTLFLDEVGNMSLALQVRLLRVLEEQAFVRVGGHETVRVNVRVIAATNADLEKAVADGSFRGDLYFRLNVLTIHLPPLRERNGDLDLLIDHFVEQLAHKHEKPVRGLRPAARQRLYRHPWPGNIRELANVLERAIVSCEGPYLEADDIRLAPQVPLPDGAPPAAATLEDVERWHILRVLEYVNGNKARAAEILGVNRMTLYRKLGRDGVAARAAARDSIA